MVQLQKFTNLIDLLLYFNTEQVSRDYLELIRWNGALECPYKDCKGGKICKYSDGKRYKCAACKRQYSVKVGTIFEDSKIPLQKWFAAIYLLTAHKKGISSLQLHRDIGVTQKTAWYMMHRVRHTLGFGMTDEKLTGTIEADEHFVGGLEANKHASKRTPGTQGRSTQKKIAVAGIVQRGGAVRAQVVSDTGSSNLHKFVYKNVQPGSVLHTDEWYGYNGLEKLYKRSFVNHNSQQYVNGDCHTNTMEGFWSLLSRGIIGIYHSVSGKHLNRYLDEFCFRYSTRKVPDNQRFNIMLNNISITLPYKNLIADARTNATIRPVDLNQWLEAKQGHLGF